MNQLKSWLIKKLIGKEVTIFITKKGSDCFHIEVGDSKNRKQLFKCEVEKKTSIRYWLKDYLPF